MTGSPLRPPLPRNPYATAARKRARLSPPYQPKNPNRRSEGRGTSLAGRKRDSIQGFRVKSACYDIYAGGLSLWSRDANRFSSLTIGKGCVQSRKVILASALPLPQELEHRKEEVLAWIIRIGIVSHYKKSRIVAERDELKERWDLVFVRFRDARVVLPCAA